MPPPPEIHPGSRLLKSTIHQRTIPELIPTSGEEVGDRQGPELIGSVVGRRSSASAASILAFALAVVCGLGVARAQEERSSKVPVLGKVAGGATQQAFSGKVQSLDLKRKLLNVNTVEGGGTEIFPIKKGVQVSTAGGEKLKLAQLTPGTDIIVYYEQKNARRTVKEIVVLAASPAEAKKKKTPPPS